MTPEESTKHTLLSDWIIAGKKAKKPIEWEWFVRKNYLDGNHWIRWNQATKSIEQVNSGNKFRTTINEVYRITRAVRTYVTKHHPRWEVMATDLDKRVFEKSTASEKLLDMYYFQEQIKRKLKEIVYDALYSSLGHLWFWWDAKDQWFPCKGIDPWDFIPDPTAEDTLEYSDAKFVARAYKKKAKEIQADSRFKNTGEVAPDNLVASSDMKTALLQLTAGLNPNSWAENRDLETTMCYELYYRVGDYNEKEGKVNHSIITPTTILVDEPTRFNEIPVRTYHTDTETGKQYTQGWVKNLIGPQKIIDQNETQTLEYNHIFGKGRYVTEKGSGVNTIVNRNGQIVTKNRGTYFEQLRTDPQPASVENQTIRASRYMENIGAAHDAFVGRMPTGANSGVAIDTLLQGEENNLADLRDNLDDFMVSTARLVLRTFARNRMSIVSMFNQEPDQKEPNFFAAVGNKSPIMAKNVPISYNGEIKKVTLDRIMEENNIRVTMGTWLGMNKIGGQTKLLELASAGLVDKQSVLEYYNAPNIPAIMTRLNEQEAQKALMQAAVSQPPGTVPAIPQPGAGATGGGIVQGGLAPIVAPTLPAK